MEDIKSTTISSKIRIILLSIVIITTTLIVLSTNNKTLKYATKSLSKYSHRLLSSSSSHKLIENIKKVKTKNAPIFMQDTDSTPPIVLLFEKYGMTGTGKTLKKHPKKNSNTDSSTDGDSNSDWAIATEYGGTTCGDDGSDKYFIAGVKLDTCIPFLSQTPMSGGNKVSFVINCDEDDGISYYEYYDDGDCSSEPASSKVIAKIGCQENGYDDDNWFTFDDDDYPSSVSISCKANSKTPPYGSGQFDMWNLYSDGGEGTCDSSEYTYFEAYALNVCIPIQVFSLASDDKSVMFKKPLSGSTTPFVKYYTEAHDCSGTHTSYYLDTDCTQIESFLVSSKYSYYDN